MLTRSIPENATDIQWKKTTRRSAREGKYKFKVELIFLARASWATLNKIYSTVSWHETF
jgi:hypothetical protein